MLLQPGEAIFLKEQINSGKNRLVWDNFIVTNKRVILENVVDRGWIRQNISVKTKWIVPLEYIVNISIEKQWPSYCLIIEFAQQKHSIFPEFPAKDTEYTTWTYSFTISKHGAERIYSLLQEVIANPDEVPERIKELSVEKIEEDTREIKELKDIDLDKEKAFIKTDEGDIELLRIYKEDWLVVFDRGFGQARHLKPDQKIRIIPKIKE